MKVEGSLRVTRVFFEVAVKRVQTLGNFSFAVKMQIFFPAIEKRKFTIREVTLNLQLLE